MTARTRCRPFAQQARQDELEELYFADRRDDPRHSMHGLYTGLFQPAGESPRLWVDSEGGRLGPFGWGNSSLWSFGWFRFYLGGFRGR